MRTFLNIGQSLERSITATHFMAKWDLWWMQGKLWPFHASMLRLEMDGSGATLSICHITNIYVPLSAKAIGTSALA